MEEAFETPVKDDPYTTKRGRFSMALLKLFYERPLDNLLYSDILHYMDVIPCQSPQCTGRHEGRLIFDSKIPPARYKAFTVKYERGHYMLQAGALQKVTRKSNFAVFSRSDIHLTHQLGSLSVTKIWELSSQATVKPTDDDNFDPGLDIVAVRIKSNAEDDLKIFIAPGDKLFSVYNQCLQQGLEDVTLVKDRQNANIDIATVRGKVLFTLHSLPHPLLNLSEWKHSIKIDRPAQLVHILSKAAHFYRELKLVENDKSISSEVEVNFYQLEEVPDSKTRELRPVVGGKNFCEDGVINVSHDEEVMYGIELVNKSSRALYANLFYFSNKDLSIVQRAGQTPSAGHKRDPCLQPQLPHNGTLTIGWGEAGYQPDGCVLDEGEDRNTEFLKIYLSSQPVNLAYLTQSSPFSLESSRAMKTFNYNREPEFWTDLVIPVVQNRKASPRVHN